MRALDKTHN